MDGGKVKWLLNVILTELKQKLISLLRFRKAIASNDCFWGTYWMTVEYVCNEMGFEEKEEY